MTADGALQSNGRTFYTGDIDQETGALYLVRDIYFEPDMGHKADRALTDVINRTSCARASLIEMHRFNFLSEKQHALNELKHLLDKLSERLPHVLFLTVEELASVYQTKDGMLFHEFSKRLWILVKRIQLLLQYNRVAKYSGFNRVLNLITMVK